MFQKCIDSLVVNTEFDNQAHCMSSIGATLGSMTSRRQIQDGGPHDVRSKMAAPRRQIQDGGPHDTKMAAPVTRSVTPRRVSQRSRPREGSVTS